MNGHVVIMHYNGYVYITFHEDLNHEYNVKFVYIMTYPIHLFLNATAVNIKTILLMVGNTILFCMIDFTSLLVLGYPLFTILNHFVTILGGWIGLTPAHAANIFSACLSSVTVGLVCLPCYDVIP